MNPLGPGVERLAMFAIPAPLFTVLYGIPYELGKLVVGFS